MKTLILAANPGAYFYPWVNSASVRVLPPASGLALARRFGKIILVNGIEQSCLFDPVLDNTDRYFFLWDPARCPFYAPAPDVLERLKQRHKVYSFQEEDCRAFGLQFNSTMYAPPPPGLLPEAPGICCDLLFLGVPKDRLPLLRTLHGKLHEMGLRACFRIALTGCENLAPEQGGGWLVTRDWIPYPVYLHWVQQSRAILDIYQAIQTGFSLRVMEHIFFGKKLVTNNAVIQKAAFYHPDNIFLLQKDDIACLKDWLDLPFVPIDENIKNYYRLENWIERFA